MNDELEEEWEAAFLTLTAEQFDAFWQWIMDDSEGVPVSTS